MRPRTVLFEMAWWREYV